MDGRIGSEPDPIDHASSCFGAVSHSRNVMEAFTRAGLLLKMTQLSGPDTVWWLVVTAGSGTSAQSIFAWLSTGTVHGPLTYMARCPLVNNGCALFAVGSRDTEWSTGAICCQSVRFAPPACELRRPFFGSGRT